MPKLWVVVTMVAVGVVILGVQIVLSLVVRPTPPPSPVKTTFCLAERSLGLAFCNDSVDGRIVREYRIQL